MSLEQMQMFEPALVSSTKKTPQKPSTIISDKNAHIKVFQIKHPKRLKLCLLPVAISG